MPTALSLPPSSLLAQVALQVIELKCLNPLLLNLTEEN